MPIYEYFCQECRERIPLEYWPWPVLCKHCGRETRRRYAVTWPPKPPAFSMRFQVRRLGESRSRQDVKIEPSVSKDGRIATVFQEIDRLDPDKTKHRYRKKVIAANGHVVKDIDVWLASGRGHGNAGVQHDPPPPEIPGDPLRAKLSYKNP